MAPFALFDDSWNWRIRIITFEFKEFFNLKTPFGSKTDPNYPLDEGYVFQVNIVIAWPVIIIGAILANIAPWIGFSMMLFELTINNFMHTIGFQTGKPTYNPGLITNSVLLLPLATITFITALQFFQWYDWVLSVIAGAALVGLLAFKTKSRLGKLKGQWSWYWIRTRISRSRKLKCSI